MTLTHNLIAKLRMKIDNRNLYQDFHDCHVYAQIMIYIDIVEHAIQYLEEVYDFYVQQIVIFLQVKVYSSVSFI